MAGLTFRTTSGSLLIIMSACFQLGLFYVIFVAYGRTAVGVSGRTVSGRYSCLSSRIIQGYGSVMCLTCVHGRQMRIDWKGLKTGMTNLFDIFEGKLG